MNAEQLRAFLLTLPHVAETLQWGANLVFWVGDKAIGGKMFALLNLDEPTPAQLASGRPAPVLSFASTPARFAELVEHEALIPAPYLARAHWIAALGYDALSAPEWKRELLAAHATILAKLPARTRHALALPAAELRRLIATRKKLLATRKTK